MKRTKKEKNTYSQTSQLENPKEIQLHHNHEKILFQDQDTRLRMPNKWHICKKGGAKQATKKDNAAASFCFLNYLAFLRPAADRAVSILTPGL
jgi:hypothetical protein